MGTCDETATRGGAGFIIPVRSTTNSVSTRVNPKSCEYVRFRSHPRPRFKRLLQMAWIHQTDSGCLRNPNKESGEAGLVSVGNAQPRTIVIVSQGNLAT